MFLPAAPLEKPLSVAILAMGGQGGGVLADWIVAVAEENGWYAQSTSVPGVAQRTGATLYYIEMLPPRDGKAPILALMPTPGDVDVVIASELMEAGRSILRGLATPDRTLLITSTHRAYAVAEKEKPGEGTADPRAVNAAGRVAARRIIAFDMEEAARRSGTVISSPVFGALAGSGALPFSRQSFEAVIRTGGKGIEASLRGFSAGFDRANRDELAAARIAPEPAPVIVPDGDPRLAAPLARIAALPEPVRAMTLAGFRRVVDYQDLAYGLDYLRQVEAFAAKDEPVGSHAFTRELAKYLAGAMAYDDVIAVADLKTRSTRFARIARDMKAGEDPMAITEFMHPGASELVGLLPRGLGEAVQARPKLMAAIDRVVNKGRHVRTASLSGFLPLYVVAGLRRFRRGNLRHASEMAHVAEWLGLAERHLPANYELAVGIVKARRLIKGYSDTHARGLSKYDRVLAAVPLLAGRDDAGAWIDRLISAALKDEDGKVLDGALATIRTL